MSTRRVQIIAIQLFISLVILAGCQDRLPPLTVAAADLPTKVVTDTATPITLPTLLATSTPAPMVQTTATQPPLEITFPTPGTGLVPIWRPPLEPAPWALGPHDHFYFVRPILVNEVNWPLNNYRYGYIFPDSDAIHTGVDIDAPRGTIIHAAASGTVVWAGFGLLSGDQGNKEDPYGMAVVVRHDFGFEGHRLSTVYAHMEQVLVQVGQKVQAGDDLGLVGDTGFTTGPHVHFEVRLETDNYFTTRNPELWMVPPEGDGVLVGRLLNTDGSWLDAHSVDVIGQDRSDNQVFTYAATGIYHDDYYQENLVLSDLPAGNYTVKVSYDDKEYDLKIAIHSGAISYFTYQGTFGYKTDLPALPDDSTWLVTPEP
jgi:murein DD-endopeptidase MepM/ murein hydrolase activator NlpD